MRTFAIFFFSTGLTLTLGIWRLVDGNLDGAAAWVALSGVNCLWYELGRRRA